ncbi:glycosyltransferase [Cetobacterium somerae]|uniref:glycosyltransferase family 2 protein n=1 Tax=Cetobacterium sp. NK01 TaxID=2993530 RepID=UPI0021160FF7|nr:glycosyltransferase family A protein [Cetobacterium sp. NK01]MCQ8212121.1 glycosyltransferase [Cetobacterium sp. NK01]
MSYKNEKVSIIIPTYKRPFFLKRIIENLNEQTYKNLEIIIVDDNKKDSTEKKETSNEIQKIIEIYKNLEIKYISNYDNKGANYSRNVGVKNAQGKFISFLDDDDEYLSNRIEIMMKKINEKDFDMVCCDWEKVIFKRKSLKKLNVKDQIKDFEVSFEQILTNNIIGGASLVLMKKEVFNSIHGFDINLVSCQDWDLYIRIIKSGYRVLKLKDKLVRYNIHLGERISTNRNKVIKGHLYIKNKYYEDRKQISNIKKILFNLKLLKQYLKFI